MCQRNRTITTPSIAANAEVKQSTQSLSIIIIGNKLEGFFSFPIADGNEWN